MADNRPVRPIVETRVMTEFGEVLEDSRFYEAVGANGDLTYVPGYSDLRRARDLAVAEVAHGQRKKADIPILPVRMQWVRSARVSGEPDSTKEVESGNDGYRTATKADIGKDWLKELPAGAKVVAGGAIRKGDVTLMVCDAPRAARNAARVRLAIDRQCSTAGSKLLAQGERVKGSDPTFESKLADKPIGQE